MTQKMPLIALLAASVSLLSSCGNRDLTTGSIPADYRARHPIMLTEAQSVLDVPVSPSDTHLTIGMKDTIRGFVQNFANSSSGVIQIQMPQGSTNSPAASRLGTEIRSTIAGAGIRSQRIVMTSYAASPSGDAAPIRLSYTSTKAVTQPCGSWPEDLTDDTSNNTNWYNFGCASQNNLAAQIANPTDLMGPRGTTPIDATRRSTVIDAYRSGTDPSSK